MTREQAKANLVALGVTEPTDEQVSNYLNQFSGETNTLKTQLAEAQKKATDVETLRTQLKDLEDSKLTDEEKAQKEAKAKDKAIADLNAKIQAMELKNQLAEQGITGEDADKLIESSKGGSLDVALLGQIIKTREENAAMLKEQEIAKGSTNPNGGSGSGDGSGDDDKPEDVLNAEAMKNVFGTMNTDADKQNYYVLN